MRATPSGKAIWILMAALFPALALAGCAAPTPAPSVTTAAPTSAPPAATPTTAEVVAFVDRALAYAKINGKEAALKAFNTPGGEFHDGGLYIFAYDYKGNVLALGNQPEKVGQNFWDLTDANGVHPIRELTGIASSETGSGWLNYLWPNPLQGNEPAAKLGYAQRVDDQWFIGSGMYPSAAATAQAKAAVVAFVDRAVAYAKANGKEAALKAFNTPGGQFHDGELYIYAYDYQGNALAHGADPKIVGKNLMDLKDAEGIYPLRITIKATQGPTGKGWAIFVWPNPEHNNARELKHAYAQKVDEDWFVGSGTYAAAAD